MLGQLAVWIYCEGVPAYRSKHPALAAETAGT